MSQTNYIIEGITHIEDLPVNEFISAIRNLGKMIATEKLDGAQLWFGLDDQGRLYTSRAGKRRSAENVYSEADYRPVSASNGFRAAHAALQAKEDEIKKYLRNGQTVEIEVLYGRQPNAVTYGAGGKNYIAFLRGVNGTPDTTVEQLANMLNGNVVQVSVEIIDTNDGVTLNKLQADLDFQFVDVQKIDSTQLTTVNLEKQLKALEKFLAAKVSLDGLDVTNAELLATSLGSIDKEIRPQAKAIKSEIAGKILTDFKLPIKKELLDKFVRQVKSTLSADDLDDDEDNGVEGVVLRDPVSGVQIKLVDKDGFTTINQFNYALRNMISGPIRSIDNDVPLETRGGIIGDLKIKIADLLGNKDLARPAVGKKIFQGVKGSSPEATMRNVISGLKGDTNFRATKRKILALIAAANASLGQALDDFKATQENYQLLLKSGKKMGLSKEVVKRTLLAFAESKRDLAKMFESIKSAKSLTQVAVIFWGKYAVAIHQDAPLEESILTEKKFQTDKKLYANKDAWQLINNYLATVLLSALMYKTKDKIGLRMLKDKSHYRMTSWSAVMSPLNFWGYPIWRHSQPAVKKLIGKKASLELGRVIKKVPASHSRMLHMDLSFGNDVPINWNDHYKTLKQLQWFPGLRTDRINKLLIGVLKYEDLNLSQKIKTLNALYFYSQQFVPSSPLISRLRVIQHNVLINANGENDLMIEGSLLRQVTENAEGAIGIAAVSANAPAAQSSSQVVTSTNSSGVFSGTTNQNGGTAAATVAGAIASKEIGIGKGKHIIRRKRNPNVLKKKFARPEKRKDNESA